MAAINAIYCSNSWSFTGRGYANTYTSLVFGKSLDEIDLDTLEGDQLLCIGYIELLDNYNTPEKTIPILKKSKRKKS